MSRILTAPDPQHPLTDADFAASFHRVADAAARVDGYRPFNEQVLFDLAAGARQAYLIAPDESDDIVGALVVGRGELDFVIVPEARRMGHGRSAFAQALATESGDLVMWSHGDHPAARVLAARFGFVAARTLLQLRLSLAEPEPTSGADADAQATPAAASSPPIRIEPFRPGQDDADWVALNALVFAQHPEQGALTLRDLAARQAEEWFDPGDFLVARGDTGRLVGYNWLKVEGTVGEIYVIGVHPDAAGQGLGRALMRAGLDRLRARGCTIAELYVEAESTGAVHLYRSLGFTEHTVDVQYRRLDRDATA